jgi:hypothetical protein
MKRVGTAAGYLVGWIVAFVASSAATYQLSFLINKFGPSCRGGGPHHIPAMDLWVVPFAGFVAATILVVLWWVLAAPPGSRGGRLVAATLLAAASVVPAFVAAAFVTPLCT